MKIKLIFFFIAVFFVSAVFAQDCSFYYPESEGAELVYQVYDKKDKPAGKTSHKVVAYSTSAKSADAKIEVKTFDSDDKPIAETVLEVRCEEGVFYFDMEGYLNQQMMSAYEEMEVRVDASDLAMPSKLSVGQDLGDGSISVEISNSGIKMMTMQINISDRKVEAEESVSTPAGTFSCFKISQTTTIKAPMKMVMKSTEWLSPGTGLIKNESYKSDGKPTGRTELIELNK